MKILEILAQKIAEKSSKIEEFFAQKFSQNPPLFYNSIDLRHSGVKIAPVDTNCYPAGFNNLSDASQIEAQKIADEFFNKNFPSAKKIIIIAESHTRNLRYLENVRRLAEIIAATREVFVGTLLTEVEDKMAIDLENGRFLELHALQKIDGKISTKSGFVADVAILNNDLSNGIPELFVDCETPIEPSPLLGWHARKKSTHFTIYNELAKELAAILEIDPWLISSFHKTCDKVDFKERVGLDCLAKHVEEILAQLRKKYAEFGIDDEPYCYIKADSGTYGIGVWPVFSGQEVLEINKKERNKMHMLKGSVQNTRVMIQEGIKTIDRIDGKIAEPMIYLINGEVVGNMFRANNERDEKISLNATGAEFFDLQNLEQNQLQLGLKKNHLAPVYSIISRLAALAAAIENQQLKND
jgi:glutamate--cysteine ligase